MLPPILQSVIDWVGQHPHWGYLAVFLVALGESLAVVGLFMPGTVINFAFGALVGTGALALWPTLIWAAIGAVIGDGLSYWLGWHYRDRLRTFWPFSRYPQLMARGEDFFHRHGGKSVLLGRFVGPVRPFVPVVAGMLLMPARRFLSVNIVSALLWAPAYILPGVVFGASLGLAAEVTGRLVVLAAGIIALLWLAIWLVYRIYGSLAPRTEAIIDTLLRWGRAHPYLGRYITALVDPQQPEARSLTLIGLVLVAIAWGIVTTAQRLALDQPLLQLDRNLYHLLQDLRTPWGDHLMVALSALGDGAVQAALGTAVLIWLLWQRLWLAAGHWVAAIGFGLAANGLLKQSLQLPRPAAGLYEGVLAYGFPSLHATLAAVVYGFLSVLIARELSPRWRWPCHAVAVVLISAVGVSRLYLGAHWLSDVLGGILLGLAWVVALGLAYRRHVAPPVSLRGLSAVVTLVMVVVGSWHLTVSHEHDLARYTPQRETILTTTTAWRDSGWLALPGYRVDLRGGIEQPFNLQWAGDLKVLQRHLTATGWHTAPPLTFTNSLHWLAPTPQWDQLPLLPQLHAGRTASLTLVSARHEWLLRLWPADVTLTDGGTPVWIGYAAQLTLANVPFINVPHTGSNFDAALQALMRDMQTLNWRLTQRPVATGSAWSGTTLIVTDRNEISSP